MKLKNVLAGFSVLIIGLIINIILLTIFQSSVEGSYYAMIGFSIIYLAAIIFVCTLMIIDNKKK
jgi:hypothetical protein